VSRFRFDSAQDKRRHRSPSFGRLYRPVGQIASLEIQDRADIAKAAGRASKQERDRANREAGKRTNAALLGAAEWARRVGFTPEQEPFAVMAALMLRSACGAGNVTRQMVLDRCRAQHPELFGELTREQAA